MRYEIVRNDSILDRYANQIAAIGEKQAHVAFARALNHEGMKGFTQVKRALVAQTGIKYGQVSKAVKAVRASAGSLSFTLEGRGNETNLRLFGAIQRKSGVSAAPWNVRRIFRSADGQRGSFINPVSGLVMIRTGKDRYPLESLYGPNIAREMVKGETLQAWEAVPVKLQDRISHELGRMLPG